jgi:hypothetical protein
MGRSEIDPSKHGRNQVDGENIVRISEETDTGYDTGTNMEPAKLCVVNLKGEDKNEKKKLAYTS